MPRGQISEPKEIDRNHSPSSGLTNARYRITFGKGVELRFTGHLDLHHAWERTFRRAKLSLAYSEGFRPRPKINIGAALPLGCTSEADLVDTELEEESDVVQLIEKLEEAAPPGLSISEIVTIPEGSPKLQKLIESSEYLIPIPNEDAAALQPLIEELLSSEELLRKRRGKEYDLRPLIEEMSLTEAPELRLQLAARSSATGRPDEVLLALDLDPTPLVPRRVRLILK